MTVTYKAVVYTGQPGDQLSAGPNACYLGPERPEISPSTCNGLILTSSAESYYSSLHQSRDRNTQYIRLNLARTPINLAKGLLSLAIGSLHETVLVDLRDPVSTEDLRSAEYPETTQTSLL